MSVAFRGINVDKIFQDGQKKQNFVQHWCEKVACLPFSIHHCICSSSLIKRALSLGSCLPVKVQFRARGSQGSWEENSSSPVYSANAGRGILISEGCWVKERKQIFFYFLFFQTAAQGHHIRTHKNTSGFMMSSDVFYWIYWSIKGEKKRQEI